MDVMQIQLSIPMKISNVISTHVIRSTVLAAALITPLVFNAQLASTLSTMYAPLSALSTSVLTVSHLVSVPTVQVAWLYQPLEPLVSVVMLLTVRVVSSIIFVEFAIMALLFLMVAVYRAPFLTVLLVPHQHPAVCVMVFINLLVQANVSFVRLLALLAMMMVLALPALVLSI